MQHLRVFSCFEPVGNGNSRSFGLESYPKRGEFHECTRRRFGTDQKATILKRYLVDKVPISDLCDEYGIKPNQIYAWQKILFDNVEAAFHPVAKRAASKLSAQEEKIARLENKLQQKNEVISELMEENIRAKKSIGEL